MNQKTALKILGVLPDVTEEQLKKRYHELMLKTHPDVCNAHDYPYEVYEINQAYEYLLKNPVERNIQARKTQTLYWNAPVNENAFAKRPIYQYFENQDGEKIGTVHVGQGKYIWTLDEDFPLFLKSIYETARQIIEEDDARKNICRINDMKLMADIAYLLAGQFFDAKTALQLMKENEDHIFYARAMLEQNLLAKMPKPGDVLIPAGVREHRLYVADEKGQELGYLSFADDRLLFGIIPLFERRCVQVKMSLAKKTESGSRRQRNSGKHLNVDFWLRLLPENAKGAIDSINLKIQQLLDMEM